MNTLTKNLIAALVALIIVFGFYASTHQQSTSKFGDVTNYSPLPVDPTDSSVVCGPTSGLLLATSSAGRPLVYLSNASTTSTAQVYLGMGHAAVVSSGLMMPANTTIGLNQGSVFLKAIYCIASASTTVSISAVN